MARTAQIINIEAVIFGTAVGLLTALGLYWYQKKKTSRVPTVWQPVAKVKKLYIYPLKSGHRIELEKAICTDFGVKMPKTSNFYQFHDRSLLVYKENDNEFQTARQHPKMIFIKVAPTDQEYFTLEAPGMPVLRVKIPNLMDTNKRGQITLHKGEKIPTVDCGDAAAKWISQYILNRDSGMKIGFHDGLRRRNINETHKKYFSFYPNLRNGATGMYSDLSSYLLINQASVDELSNKIPESDVSVLNFRPNILVEGKDAGAYAEDNWNWVKIGDVILYSARPCTRCVFTTINPKTATKSEINEPLKTMRTYRQLKDLKNISLDGTLPVMGINMGLQNGGEINVGDVVYVGKC